MTLSGNFALKRGGGRNNEGGVTTREYGNTILQETIEVGKFAFPLQLMLQ